MVHCVHIMVNTLVWLSAVSHDLLADLRSLTHINERGVNVIPRHRSWLLPWYVPALSLHFPVGIWYSCLGPCAPLFASPPSNLMGVKPLLFCLKHRQVTYYYSLINPFFWFTKTLCYRVPFSIVRLRRSSVYDERIWFDSNRLQKQV